MKVEREEDVKEGQKGQRKGRARRHTAGASRYSGTCELPPLLRAEERWGLWGASAFALPDDLR